MIVTREMSMGRFLITSLLVGVVLGMSAMVHADNLTAVPFQDVRITDAFWSKRIHTNRSATIEANLHQCEITGRIRNFAIAGKLEEGKHKGLLYDDSDLYKVIEGIAYTLSTKRD